MNLNRLADFLFEARSLKSLPRSGFAFLGVGRESVAEHSYLTTMIAFTMAQLEPGVDGDKLIRICLLHDLCEARTGDLNHVQKQYLKPNEPLACAHALEGLPFSQIVKDHLAEFEDQQSVESKLAHDADQLALVMELKDLGDIGYRPPAKWLPNVLARLKTDLGRSLAEAILQTDRDRWWLDGLTAANGLKRVDSDREN